MQTETIENIFARAWTLLARNPVIVVPGLIVGLLLGIFDGAMALSRRGALLSATTGNVDPAALVAQSGQLLIAAALAIVAGIVAFLVTQTYTTGMAAAAWQNGTTTLAEGAASFREDAGRLLAAVLLVAVLGIVVGVFSLGLGWFVVLFFAIYLVPAVVIDNRGAISALRFSATIAFKRALTTFLIVLLVAVVGLVIGVVTLPLAFIPFLGPIVSAVITQAVTAYATLVIVGEYLNVRRSPDIIAAGPTL